MQYRSVRRRSGIALYKNNFSAEDGQSKAEAIQNRPAIRKDAEKNQSYYLNPETSRIAQKIYDNKELSLLFDAAQDAEPEDLQTVHSMLMALKRKEKG